MVSVNNEGRPVRTGSDTVGVCDEAEEAMDWLVDAAARLVDETEVAMFVLRAS